MGTPETCMRCGSTDLIPTARVCGYGSADVMVFVERNPEALLRKGAEREALRGCVCAACGHVEVFVDHTSHLREAYADYEESRSEEDAS